MVVLNEYHFEDEKMAILDQISSNSKLPTIFACTDVQSSFIELDPFASTRELAKFFHTDFVELQCQRDELLTSIRKGVVWIVPLTDSILGHIQELTFWTPKNFDADIDTLVYVAPSSFNNNSLFQKIPIQMDKNLFPLEMNVVAQPPSSEILYQSPEQSFSYKTRFKLVMKSENEVPLAWKATSLPIFYLQIPITTPNRELSRSQRWVQFWFDVAKTVKKSATNLEMLELTDVNKIEEEFPANKNISQYLNLQNLQYEKATHFTLGLYKLKDKNKLLFLKKSLLNNSEKIMNEYEFSSHFQTDSALPNENMKSSSGIYFAYIFFVLSLFSLWFLQGRDI